MCVPPSTRPYNTTHNNNTGTTTLDRPFIPAANHRRYNQYPVVYVWMERAFRSSRTTRLSHSVGPTHNFSRIKTHTHHRCGCVCVCVCVVAWRRRRQNGDDVCMCETRVECAYESEECGQREKRERKRVYCSSNRDPTTVASWLADCCGLRTHTAAHRKNTLDIRFLYDRLVFNLLPGLTHYFLASLWVVLLDISWRSMC